MKILVKTALLAVLVANLSGCATPEERRRRDAERAREDARYEAEAKKRDRQRDEEDWQDFLDDYARDLGKSKSELTSAERQDARREFEGRGRYHRYRPYHYWY